MKHTLREEGGEMGVTVSPTTKKNFQEENNQQVQRSQQDEGRCALKSTLGEDHQVVSDLRQKWSQKIGEMGPKLPQAEM